MTAEQILRELIEEYHIADFVYDVKEREGNGWQGPSVVRYSFLINEAEKLLK